MNAKTSSLEGMVKIPRIRLKGSSNKQSCTSSSTTSSSQHHQHKSAGPTPLSAIHVDQIRSVNLKHIEHHRSYNNNNKKGTGVVNIMSGGGAFSKESSDSDEDGGRVVVVGSLIKPKKLPNPIKESVAMQNIHKELLLNQKIGRSVLTHKTELQKALEKLATRQPQIPDEEEDEYASLAPHPPPMPKHPEQETNNKKASKKKNEFQRILEARAKQIEDQKCFVDGLPKPLAAKESEFEKIHKRITTTHNF